MTNFQDRMNAVDKTYQPGRGARFVGALLQLNPFYRRKHYFRDLRMRHNCRKHINERYDHIAVKMSAQELINFHDTIFLGEELTDGLGNPMGIADYANNVDVPLIYFLKTDQKKPNAIQRNTTEDYYHDDIDRYKLSDFSNAQIQAAKFALTLEAQAETSEIRITTLKRFATGIGLAAGAGTAAGFAFSAVFSATISSTAVAGLVVLGGALAAAVGLIGVALLISCIVTAVWQHGGQARVNKLLNEHFQSDRRTFEDGMTQTAAQGSVQQPLLGQQGTAMQSPPYGGKPAPSTAVYRKKNLSSTSNRRSVRGRRVPEPATSTAPLEVPYASLEHNTRGSSGRGPQ